MDQLRKELEEERQLQELQRLQEAQTGKKKVEKLEWMYATPAAGGGPSANDLEEYLLGKKRVDQMLTGDEAAKVSCLSYLHFRSILTQYFYLGWCCPQEFHRCAKRQHGPRHCSEDS